MVQDWSPLAASNNLIMIFPRVSDCWDTFTGYTGLDTYLTKNGFEMLFMKKIVDIISEPLDLEGYQYDQV